MGHSGPLQTSLRTHWFAEIKPGKVTLHKLLEVAEGRTAVVQLNPHFRATLFAHGCGKGELYMNVLTSPMDKRKKLQPSVVVRVE